jgi:hypothetical protein
MAEPKNDKIDTVLLLLTQGAAIEKVKTYCINTLRMSDDDAATTISEARKKLTLAADYVRDEQLGTAITRFNDLYSKAISERDFKTALQAQDKLCKLMGLFNSNKDNNGNDNDDSARRLELIEQYILPLKLTSENYPVEEHVRVAAEYLRKNKLGGVFKQQSQSAGA